MSNKHDGWSKFKIEIGNRDLQAGIRAIDKAIGLLHDEYGLKTFLLKCQTKV